MIRTLKEKLGTENDRVAEYQDEDELTGKAGCGEKGSGYSCWYHYKGQRFESLTKVDTFKGL